MEINNMPSLSDSEINFLGDNWCSEESFKEADDIYSAEYKTNPMPAAEFFKEFYGSEKSGLSDYDHFIGGRYDPCVLLISIVNYKGEAINEMLIYNAQKHSELNVFNGKYNYS